MRLGVRIYNNHSRLTLNPPPEVCPYLWEPAPDFFSLALPFSQRLYHLHMKCTPDVQGCDLGEDTPLRARDRGGPRESIQLLLVAAPGSSLLPVPCYSGDSDGRGPCRRPEGSHSPVLSSVSLGSVETEQVLTFVFKLAGGGSHMGSLQGAELQQGLKPANLELSLGEQRGWGNWENWTQDGHSGSQQDLGRV